MPRLHAVAALLLLLLPAVPAIAQAPEPRLVRVRLDAGLRGATLLEAGFDVLELREGRFATLLEWPGDEARLAGLGITSELVDAHPGRTAADLARAELARTRRATPARGPGGTLLTPPVGSGSMGGYWTLDEVKMKLDELVAGDAHDVVADQLDTLGTTWQGRPVWGLKLGKAMPEPDTRPVAFFNSLTHAREPGGMQALFYFVDQLLAGYGTDPMATYLLDHRVVYVVPVVNPDGYRRNQTIFDGGGGFGLWRKNLRDNDGSGTVTSSDGVDINRNFAYQWGLNNVGSSNSPSSETYRGPSAASEPETQAQRDIVNALRPVTGVSFHTYSDLLLHPWGYTATAAPDSAKFYEWNDEMSLGNGYHSGQAPRVLYEVNGEFNDWCYGDVTSKPRVFSWTPEAGSSLDGFWPPPSRIVPIARENLRTCMIAAAIAGPWVRAERFEILEGTLDAGRAAHVAVRARNRGLAAAPDGLIGTLTALDDGAVAYPGSVGYPALAPMTSADGEGGATFLVAARDTVTPGRLVRFRIDFTAPDGFYSCDTLEILVGTPTVVAEDFGATGLFNWSKSGDWGVVTIDTSHPSRYFADSPFGTAGLNVNHHMTWRFRLNLSAGVHAWALYETRWNHETDYDGTVFEGSLDSLNWVPLPGRATVAGLQSPQPVGLPVYEGARHRWAPERVDLSRFAGPTANPVWFRFRTRTDGGSSFDGFNFDSLRVLVFDPAAQPEPVAVGAGPAAALELAVPSPSPVRDHGTFRFALPQAGRVRLAIVDLQGRHVRTLADGDFAADRFVRGWDLRDDAGARVAPGVYLAMLATSGGRAVQRFVVLR
jgi:hypothetical protein